MIQDFTRIIPKQGYEEWPNKLCKMNELFRQVEYQMVKKNFRQAAIIQVDPNNLQFFLEKTNKDHLIFTPLKKISISNNGFSALAKTPELGKPFMWTGCLTKNYQGGQQFKEAYFKNDHKIIGKMLGYPSCCIDYFIRAFPIDPCPIWIDLNGKAKGFPECNGMLRYFGVLMTAHLSCSPTCEATKEIGKTWFKLMQEIDNNLADELYKLLASPITWNSYHGVVQIETPYFVGLNSALFVLKKPRIIDWQAQKNQNAKELIIQSTKQKKVKTTKKQLSSKKIVKRIK